MSVPVLVPLSRRRPAYAGSSLGEFDRLFNNLFQNALGNISAPSVNPGDLAVKLNVAETEHSYTISADLPGMEESDVEVTVNDGLLTLSGERKSEKEEEGKTFHRIERSYGQFKRVLQLPADADEENVAASIKNGVLEITIQKQPEVTKSAKRIDIKRG